jgi:predicted amidohydrolase
MKTKIKVAAVQMEIKPLDIEVNLYKAKTLLKEIFKEGQCDLVVFPEDFITGPIPYNLELAQNENSSSIKLFQKLAVYYQTYIVCGSIIKKVGNDYFNTSFLINKRGEIILEYQKINLWHPERRYLTSGKNIKVVSTPIGNIGIVICWDLAFPKIFSQLIRAGANIICCPSYWTRNDGISRLRRYRKVEAERNFINSICPARAIENEILFIYANAGGEAKVQLKTKMWESPQIGQSQICVPIFGTVARIDNNRDGFITYEFDRIILSDAERVYKIKKDLTFKKKEI